MDPSTQAIEPAGSGPVELTAQIVCAYVSNNSVPVDGLPALISATHDTLAGLMRDGASVGPSDPAVAKLTSAQIRNSMSREALISFEDGKPYKTLRRHLTLRGLTPEAYRTKWNLPADYPMTAPGYSEQRSQLAHNLGLGLQRRKVVAAADPAAEGSSETPKRGRPRKKEPA